MTTMFKDEFVDRIKAEGKASVGAFIYLVQAEILAATAALAAGHPEPGIPSRDWRGRAGRATKVGGGAISRHQQAVGPALPDRLADMIDLLVQRRQGQLAVLPALR